jgi:hypothetical protein
MGFKIAQGTPTPQQVWCAIDTTTAVSLYVGQLVQLSTGASNGVAPLAVASGAYDVTNDQQIYGVVTGTNNYPMTELFNATYGQYITSIGSVAGQIAIMKMGNAGMYVKGDPQPMVQVALIGPETWLEGPIYNGTYGTATTLLTPTAINATAGLGFTTNSADVATVANMCTCYCRTGANAGLYRVVKSASATTHTFDTYWPFTLAVTDTFVIAGCRQGSSYVQINSTAGFLGMCFDNSQTAATNYFGITVKELDLKEAGKEKVIFKFSAAHFAGIKS